MTPTGQRAPRSIVEDVRRFGLFSADTVVDRYVRLADGAMGRADVPAPRPGARAAPDGPGIPGLEETAGRLAVLWAGLMEAAASSADAAAEAGVGASTLELPPTAPGRRAEASVWVHNTTGLPAPVELAATTLAGPGGGTVPAQAVEFLPARLDPLNAGTSAEVRLRVHVPDGQAPGRYLGLLLSSAAEQPVLLRPEVRAAGGPGP